MAVTLDWQPKQGEWERVVAAIPRSTLEQSWVYGVAAVGQGHGVERAIVRRDREALGVVQMLTRSLLGVVRVC